MNANIYAIDIFEAGMIYDEERIKTFVADQSNSGDLKRVMDNIGPNIDIIIDDGSHRAEHQQFSFEFLEKYLQSGSIYVIEDIQPAYIESFRNLSIFSLEFSKIIQENYNIKFIDTRHITNMPDDVLLCFIKK